MEHEKEEKIGSWLTTTNQSNFKTLKVKPASPQSEIENMDGCLWFYDDERDQAECFLRDLKAFIKSTYPYPERAKWLTDTWVKSNGQHRQEQLIYTPRKSELDDMGLSESYT